MATRELKIEILGDASKAQKAFNQVDDSASGLGSKLKGFIGPAIAGGVAAAGAAIVAFGVSSVKAFAESEQSTAKLEDAFKRFPKLADSNVAAFEKQAEALAKITRFDDDATKSGQALLAQFGLTGKQVQDLTPLLQDYAAKTGKDLPDAANVLGKAIMGKGAALKAVGIDFKNTGDKGKNFEQIMGGLRTQVGGFAEKEGNTASGKLQILQNRFGEVQEKVGEKLLPILITLADWLVDTGIPAFERTITWVGDTAKAFIEFGTKVKDFVQPILRTFADVFLGVVEGIVGGAAKAFGWVPGIGGKLKAAAKAVEEFRDDVNRALGAIKDKTVNVFLKNPTADSSGSTVSRKAPDMRAANFDLPAAIADSGFGAFGTGGGLAGLDTGVANLNGIDWSQVKDFGGRWEGNRLIDGTAYMADGSYRQIGGMPTQADLDALRGGSTSVTIQLPAGNQKPDPQATLEALYEINRINGPLELTIR